MGILKRLIVNADNFGLSPVANHGVIKAHDGGIVTSASLVVTSNAAEEAVGLVLERPKLGLGLRLSLRGRSTARLDELLAEARSQLRRFRSLAGKRPTHLDAVGDPDASSAVLEVLLTLGWETGLPVRSVSPTMRERLRTEQIPTSDHFFTLREASIEALERILSDMPEGMSELACQPEEGESGSGPGELALLTNRAGRQAIQAAGIHLVHYGGSLGP